MKGKGSKEMKKSIKLIVTAVLMIPVLTVGLLAAQPASAQFTGTIQDGANTGQGNNVGTCLFTGINNCANGLFTTIINIMLYIIGALSVIMLIYGGIRYTISGGDSSAVTSAKNTILYAIVGIVVALLAYAIVNFVIGGISNLGA